MNQGIILLILLIVVPRYIAAVLTCQATNCWTQIQECSLNDTCKAQFQRCNDNCHGNLKCVGICCANQYDQQLKQVGQCIFNNCISSEERQAEEGGEQALDQCSEYQCNDLKEECENLPKCLKKWNECMVQCQDLRFGELYSCLNPCLDQEESMRPLLSCLKGRCQLQ